MPGTYQLAGNLTVPAGKDGISITSYDVTLDLNGFRIHGFSVANNGIVGTLHSATIRNGLVALFKYNGIYLAGDYHIVENMRIVGNGSGIVAPGNSTLIRGNVVSTNGNGIIATQLSDRGERDYGQFRRRRPGGAEDLFWATT